METNTVRSFNGVAVPAGETISFKDGKPVTPNHPIIPFIEGDGIGAEISGVTRSILDKAVSIAYGDQRKIAWYEVFAGDNAKAKFGDPLPADTLAAIQEFGVAIKGPLNTPTGGGMRSLNVALRKHFDLFRCVRPVRWYEGVPSPVKRPQDLDVVIFRENTEDVYSGIDFEVGSEASKRIISLLAELGHAVREDSGIGIKPISRHCSRRLVRSAIQYALAHGRKTVTLVHKGNIQKYTEGAFRQWGYEVAREEFGDIIVTEDELWSKYQGNLPEGKLLLNDRIADNMFADALLRPTRYSVIATPNLNGDYLSDATAAQVGGLGIAPGANLGDTHAIFEATHGTAPDIAGKNLANPCSLLLSGVMMLDYLGWDEAASLVVAAIEKTIAAKTVTGDLARLMDDATSLKTDEFAAAIDANMTAGHKSADNKPADASGDKPEVINAEKPEAHAGDRPEVTNAEKPEAPAGDRPEVTNAEKPEAPAGDRPEVTNAEKPEAPAGDRPEVTNDKKSLMGSAVATTAGVDSSSSRVTELRANSEDEKGSITGVERYLFREILPRAVLITLTLLYLVNLVPLGLIHFHGGLGSAAALGAGFTAMFWLLGSVLMGSDGAQRLLRTHNKAWWFIPANIAFALGAPAIGLFIATLLAPAALSISGLLGLLAGSVVLNIVCAVTHDYHSGN